MKNFYKSFASTLSMLLFASTLTYAQIPADQEVVIIEPGNATLETAINEDVDTSGARINPNRVYMLKKDGVYIMNSRIVFGGAADDDTTATLTIIGEEGGKKPVIIINPLEGANARANVVHASLKLKNVYWNATALNGSGANLFDFKGWNRDLHLEDVVVDGSMYGGVAFMKNSPGESTIIIKDSYFRDLTKFNSWNNSIYFKRIGDPIDTLWVENTTVVNGGLAFLGKSCPTKFAYFNHNTIVNVPKYAIINEQFKEAYFTNNIFINCNWQGEDINMQTMQLQSQIDFGPHDAGIVNIMEPKAEIWSVYDETAPTAEDLNVLISNNLHFNSPYLDNYYNGAFNATADYPLSNIDWGGVPEGTAFPHQVYNAPPVFLNSVTEGLIETLAGVKAADNHVGVDPLTKTKGVASQAVGNEFAKWARKDYGVADAGETFDTSLIAMGDMDPSTIPGEETEDGTGISKITDFIEDFSYDADILSTIDGLPLGALHWWNDMADNYNEEIAMENVKNYYDDPANHTIIPVLPSGVKEIGENTQIVFYPNPTQRIINIQSKLELNKALVYDATGRLIKQFDLNGKSDAILDVSELSDGIFILEIETAKGNRNVSKFIKK